ncbi:MAG: Mov34/MPN/PAD family protein [Thermoleophilia bacterium]|nr:Mov34/MPN/PAD family protein [Thermoleophilia bacterium]
MVSELNPDGSISTDIDWQNVTTSDSLAALYGWQGEGVIATASPADGEPGLSLNPKLWERLQAFGLTEKPHECVGVGLGPRGEVREFHPVENVHEQPVTRYEIAAGDQLRLYRRAEEHGWEITLVFHTHPATEPEPSQTDRALAGWPDAVYAILGLADVARPTLRAWRIVGDQVTELPVTGAPN